MKVKHYGKSVCLKMNGITDEGIPLSKVKKGQHVVLYKEIVALCIGNGKFLVYPEMSVKDLDKKQKCPENMYIPSSCLDNNAAIQKNQRNIGNHQSFINSMRR